MKIALKIQIGETEMVDNEKAKEIYNRAYEWARVKVPSQVNYNSRATYCGSAFGAGIITEEELDILREYFGDLWCYTGD
jgi:hypothetical protein